MGDTGGSVTSLIGRGCCIPISREIRRLLLFGSGGPSSAEAPPGTGASSSAGFVRLEVLGPELY